MTGQLRLAVGHRADGVSYAHSQYHEGALRIIRPHYLDDSSQITYTVVNPGGAYFGADLYDLDFTLEDGASLLVTTQSATKVYKTPQGPAVQDMTVTVGDGATFGYLPDQLIVYREGTYRQSTTVEISPTSRLAMAEIVTPGWSPDGADFTFDELRMRTEIRLRTPTGPRPFAVDNLRLIPQTTELGLGVMEGHTHSGQLLLAGPHLEDAYDALDRTDRRVRHLQRHQSGGDPVKPARRRFVAAPGGVHPIVGHLHRRHRAAAARRGGGGARRRQWAGTCAPAKVLAQTQKEARP